MNTPRILITGATGKTGTPAIKELRQQGIAVRAMAYKKDERAAALTELGAEVVVANFHDYPSLAKAVDGIEAAYFACPIDDVMLDAGCNFALAAKKAGVKRIVHMSLIIVREAHPSPAAYQCWQNENLFDWAGFQTVHLRTTVFSSMIAFLSGIPIAAQNKLFLPWGEKKISMIPMEDAGRVVARLLVDPGDYIGSAPILTGSALHSGAEIAEILSRVLGRGIEYVEAAPEDWREGMAPMMSALNLPETVLDHVIEVSNDLRAGGVLDQVTDHVARITGQPAQGLEDYLRGHTGDFEMIAGMISGQAGES